MWLKFNNLRQFVKSIGKQNNCVKPTRKNLFLLTKIFSDFENSLNVLKLALSFFSLPFLALTHTSFIVSDCCHSTPGRSQTWSLPSCCFVAKTSASRGRLLMFFVSLSSGAETLQLIKAGPGGPEKG